MKFQLKFEISYESYDPIVTRAQALLAILRWNNPNAIHSLVTDMKNFTTNYVTDDRYIEIEFDTDANTATVLKALK